MTAAEIARRPLTIDWEVLDATTDEDIARQIAEDPDVAPELTDEDFARAQRGIPVTRGNGNVYADPGLSNPNERLAKAALARAISHSIAARHLSYHAAAKLMGTNQANVTDLLRGRLADFSTERLMNFLMGLGHDVDIVVRPAPKSRKRGRLHVAT